MADTKQPKFPSEVIDLPSRGTVYPKDSPLSNGKVEIKYMTAKEEDILTSQNLIKKGIVIDVLLNSLILTKGVTSEDLIIGDKNAVMVAARILAYGSEYEVEVTNPETAEKFKHTFNLTDCPFKELPKEIDYSKNLFELKLPISKKIVQFKLLDGKDEKAIDIDLKRTQKLGTTSDITTRLRHSIVSIDGSDDRAEINTFVNNMLSRDSLALRQYITKVAPDINLEQDIMMEGELVTVDIPLTTEFFWPTTEA
jgi:hypothetical protein